MSYCEYIESNLILAMRFPTKAANYFAVEINVIKDKNKKANGQEMKIPRLVSKAKSLPDLETTVA